MQRGRLYGRLCQLSAVGGGTVPSVPLIEIIADKRVLIENHRGVYRYTREQICIHTGSGMIRVDGQKLFLEKMTHDQLTIVGRIDGVHMCRGKSDAD